MNWQELLNRMARWQFVTFPEATTKSAWKHLTKEMIELDTNNEDIEEWADVLFLAIQGGTKAAGSLNKFRLAVQDKLMKNEERQWPAEPDADNVYEHVKEETLADR